MWSPPKGWEVFLSNGAFFGYFESRNACISFLRKVESIDPNAADGAECSEKQLMGWKSGVNKWLTPDQAFDDWKQWWEEKQRGAGH